MSDPGPTSGAGASPILRAGSGLLAGTVAKVSGQVLGHLVLARHLGPGDYGVYAVALALAAFVAPAVELGAGQLLLRDVARGAHPGEATGRLLATGFRLAVPGVLAFAVLGAFLLPGAPPGPLLLLGLGVTIGSRLMMASRVFIAVGRPGTAAWLDAGYGASFAAAAVAAARLGSGAGTWLTVAGALLCAWGGLTVWRIQRTWPVPLASRSELLGTLRDGSHFAVASASASLAADLDKAMLARLGSVASAGLYGIASRIGYVALLPLMAFLGAAQPEFFRRGAMGLGAVRSLRVRVFRLSAAYAAMVVAGLGFAAPAIPVVLGDPYAEAVPLLRLLSLAIGLQILQYAFADALTSAGLQPERTRVIVGTLLLNAALNTLLIPAHGAMGAAVATILSQFACLGLLAWRVRVHEQRGRPVLEGRS